MTRGQRRAHGVIWLVLTLVLGAAAVHATLAARARWAETEAIGDAP